MTDRELLEKAAMAAGLDVCPGNGWQSDMLFIRFARPDGLWTAREWNPLNDDGDALRLAVVLGLVVDCSRPSAGEPFKLNHCAQEDPADMQVATRRAIVRAAAAMAPKPDARDPSTGGA